MKPFIRSLLFSLVSLTISTQGHAAVKSSDKPAESLDSANIVKAWYTNYKSLSTNQQQTSNEYKRLENFCTSNTVFNWLEKRINDSEITWETQDIADFWINIKECIWRNNQHRVLGFIQLICFLIDRIEKSGYITSPKDDRKKMKAELDTIKKDDTYTEDHYTFYNEKIQEKKTIIDQYTIDEISYLRTDVSNRYNYWISCVKKAFRKGVTLEGKGVLDRIASHAYTILNSIFK